jgi:hypothetical protein
MFSIGLFSTYLPYVLLAMCYGLYVGVHSIVKLEQDGDDDGEPAANMIFSDCEDNQQDAAGKTFYYDQYIAEHTTGSDPLIHRSPEEKILTKPHEDPVIRSCYLPLFSRPPPGISL